MRGLRRQVANRWTTNRSGRGFGILPVPEHFREILTHERSVSRYLLEVVPTNAASFVRNPDPTCPTGSGTATRSGFTRPAMPCGGRSGQRPNRESRVVSPTYERCLPLPFAA